MIWDTKNIAELYKKRKIRLNEILKKLQTKKNSNLDLEFQEKHNLVFKKIDCLSCANCCKTTSPMFFEKDIERLAKALRMKESQFVHDYLYMDTDGIYALNKTPCPFLGQDNYCTVYESRPKACREYPHTNSRKMHTLLSLAKTNAEICPAVQEIVLMFSEPK